MTRRRPRCRSCSTSSRARPSGTRGWPPSAPPWGGGRRPAGPAAGGRDPTAADLVAGAEGPLPQLEQAIEETLRLYPPAWIGPRRCAEPFELAGYPVPKGALVNYSSWASHRLPDVWEAPHAFRPERFGAE